MSVPNDYPVVQQVYNSGHYDLTTKIGCGLFIEDAAYALHQVNSRWGHLKKPNSLGGVNHWNHHGVDVVCYLSDTPGQTTAVDLIKAGESSAAEIGWNPDEPRYQSDDWYAPVGGQSFVLPPHNCKLGCSLFWLVGAVHRARNGEPHFYEKIDKNLDWIVDVLHGDYVRFFFSVYGIQAWNQIGADIRWSDWKPTVIEACNLAIAKGLRLAPTLVGEGANVPTESDREWLVDQSAEILIPILQHTELVEMWNEWVVTSGQLDWIQRMAERFIDHVGPDVRVALDTPPLAMGGTGESGDRVEALQKEVTEMYAHSRANTMTPQWDRAEPNPLDMGPDCRQWIYSHEPRGPGASAGGDVSDPLPLVHDYIQSAIQGSLAYGGAYDAEGHLYHSAPGAWGGECDPAFPQENEWPDLWSPPNANEIARQLSEIRAGKLPGPTPKVTYKLMSGEQIKPDGQLVAAAKTFQAKYDKNDGNFVIYDAEGNPIWASRTDGKVPAGSVQMNVDGNLVIYLEDGTPVWASDTPGHDGGMAQLQDDGFLVLYEDPNGPLAGTPYWRTEGLSGGVIL